MSSDRLTASRSGQGFVDVFEWVVTATTVAVLHGLKGF